MSVTLQKSLEVFDGNGLATEFATGIYLVSETSLVVSLLEGGGETPLALGTDYFLANVGDESGATVTFVVPPAAGQKVKLLRTTPLTQTLEIAPGGFDPEVFESQLDRIVMMMQERATDARRALRVPDPAFVSVDLPLPQPGLVLMGNAEGNGYVGGPSAAEIEGASAAAASAASSATSAAESESVSEAFAILTQQWAPTMATEAEALEGTNNTHPMTPLRTAQVLGSKVQVLQVVPGVSENAYERILSGSGVATNYGAMSDSFLVAQTVPGSKLAVFHATEFFITVNSAEIPARGRLNLAYFDGTNIIPPNMYAALNVWITSQVTYSHRGVFTKFSVLDAAQITDDGNWSVKLWGSAENSSAYAIHQVTFECSRSEFLGVEYLDAV